MAKKNRRASHEMLSDINITPFTDVVLVLLIIFMVATPIIVKGTIKVDIPKAQTSRSEKDKSLTVTIDAQEKIFLDDKQVSLEDLRNLVKKRVLQQPGVVVMVNGDKSIKCETFTKVIEATRAAGVAQYLLAAEKIRERF
jgi:biopolymer transport protein ExbD